MHMRELGLVRIKMIICLWAGGGSRGEEKEPGDSRGLIGMAERECQKPKGCRDWYLLSKHVGGGGKGEVWMVDGDEGRRGKC